MLNKIDRTFFNARTFIVFLVGCILLTSTFFTVFQTAKQKNLWLDEKFEVTSLCRFSFGDILLDGAPGQASKNPLYYLVQRISLSFVDSFDWNMLANLRRVSIAAALLILLTSFVFIQVRLGLLFAIFVVISATSQNIFYQYAAESRPYMLWLLLFTLLVMATLKMCLQNYEKCCLKDKIIFGILAFANTLIISYGLIQSGLAMLTCLFFWYFIHDHPKSLKPLINYAVPLCLLCILTQGYYTLQGNMAFTPSFMESQWDVISQLKRGDISLLKMPPRLLFPKPHRDAYIGAYLSNLFVLLGMGIPFLWWKKRKNLDQKGFFVFTWSAIVLIQVLATLVIGALTISLRYFFVQRLFLYLIICHAFLATMGAYFLFSSNRKILNFCTKGILLILFCLSLNWHWQFYRAQIVDPNKDKSCGEMAGYIEGMRREPEIRSFFSLDYMVERNRYLEKCSQDENLTQGRIYFCQALTKNYSLDKE